MGCGVGEWYLRRKCERNKKRGRKEGRKGNEEQGTMCGCVFACLRVCAFFIFSTKQQVSKGKRCVEPQGKECPVGRSNALNACLIVYVVCEKKDRVYCVPCRLSEYVHRVQSEDTPIASSFL